MDTLLIAVRVALWDDRWLAPADIKSELPTDAEFRRRMLVALGWRTGEGQYSDLFFPPERLKEAAFPKGSFPHYFDQYGAMQLEKMQLAKLPGVFDFNELQHGAEV